MNIFYNANIFSNHPQATAFAIDHGIFTAMGSDDEILNLYHMADQTINLEGKTIWPGLTDAHLHLQHLAASLAMINCETNTIDECLKRVAQATKKGPKNAWVRGHGWNQNNWDCGFGSAELLDDFSNHHPVYLTAKSLHAAWVNNKALELADIDSRTPDPPGGKIQRDQHGQPTGILFEEGAMKLIEGIIPAPTQSELLHQFKALLPKLWASGLTGVHDFDRLACWKMLQTCYQQGDLILRVQKIIPFDQLDSFIQSGFRTNFGDDWLFLGGVKLFSDGALGPQTAAMQNPYIGTDNTGNLLLTEHELIKIGKKAVSNGIAVSVHAIGDLANHTTLNAFSKIRNYEHENQLPHFRHRIEHVQVINPQDMPRLKILDILASVQPIHAPSDMLVADQYLGKRSKNAYAFQSLVKNGANIVLGSDAPVESFNPFIGIHAAVTRRRLDGSPGIDGWHPDERLSLKQSLYGYSQAPANATNRGDRLGKILTGYLADFLVLDEDPFSLDPHHLAEISPAATFINGKCVFQSGTFNQDLIPT